MEALLHSEVIGRVGCHADGRTYVVPITFVYDGNAIYCHTGDGLKLRMMRANPRVCFEVDTWRDTSNWESVVVDGRFEELHGADAEHAMAMLVDRIKRMSSSLKSAQTPGIDPEALKAGHNPAMHATLFRIAVDEATGRFEQR